MRSIAILVLVLAGGDALAKRVIMDPPLVRRCPTGTSWDQVMACLTKTSTVKVLRTTPQLRLVTLGAKGENRYDNGLLLYTVKGGRWRVGGHWQGYNTQFEVLAFNTVKVENKVGYRIDLGSSTPVRMMIDDVSPVPAITRSTRALFCGGTSYRCAEVVTSCEVLVKGGARFVFRGKLAITGNRVDVTGDRTRAGPQCSSGGTAYVYWADVDYD